MVKYSKQNELFHAGGISAGITFRQKSAFWFLIVYKAERKTLYGNSDYLSGFGCDLCIRSPEYHEADCLRMLRKRRRGREESKVQRHGSVSLSLSLHSSGERNELRQL